MGECAICGKPGDYVASDVNGIAWFECGAHGVHGLPNHERTKLFAYALAPPSLIIQANAFPPKLQRAMEQFMAHDVGEADDVVQDRSQTAISTASAPVRYDTDDRDD